MDYLRLRKDIQKVYNQSVEEWCKVNGYSDLAWVDGEWWAFPPGSVIPVPIHDLVKDCVEERIVSLVERHRQRNLVRINSIILLILQGTL